MLFCQNFVRSWSGSVSMIEIVDRVGITVLPSQLPPLTAAVRLDETSVAGPQVPVWTLVGPDSQFIRRTQLPAFMPDPKNGPIQLGFPLPSFGADPMIARAGRYTVHLSLNETTFAQGSVIMEYVGPPIAS